VIVVDAADHRAAVEALIDAGAEVHAIGREPLRIRWLASDTACDVSRADALTDSVERIGAIVHEVHLGAALRGVCRTAVLEAARARTAPGCDLDVYELL